MESMVKDAKVVETGGSESDQVAERLGKLPLDAAGGNDEDQKATSDASEAVEIEGIRFVDYKDESQLQYVMSLVGKDLSEPYSIFTYRYFLYRFPDLCILAVPGEGEDKDSEPIGCVVAKIDEEEVIIEEKAQKVLTGYIGMLAVSEAYRRKGIGTLLVQKVIQRMKDMGCTSITLETEVTNVTAQRLYQEMFGFIREELLVRYYLNWNDAYRLRLWF